MGQTSPGLIYFITGDLFHLVPLAHFTHTLSPFPLATLSLLFVSVSFILFYLLFGRRRRRREGMGEGKKGRGRGRKRRRGGGGGRGRGGGGREEAFGGEAVMTGTALTTVD